MILSMLYRETSDYLDVDISQNRLLGIDYLECIATTDKSQTQNKTALIHFMDVSVKMD